MHTKEEGRSPDSPLSTNSYPNQPAKEATDRAAMPRGHVHCTFHQWASSSAVFFSSIRLLLVLLSVPSLLSLIADPSSLVVTLLLLPWLLSEAVVLLLLLRSVAPSMPLRASLALLAGTSCASFIVFRDEAPAAGSPAGSAALLAAAAAPDAVGCVAVAEAAPPPVRLWETSEWKKKPRERQANASLKSRKRCRPAKGGLAARRAITLVPRYISDDRDSSRRPQGVAALGLLHDAASVACS